MATPVAEPATGAEHAVHSRMNAVTRLACLLGDCKPQIFAVSSKAEWTIAMLLECKDGTGRPCPICQYDLRRSQNAGCCPECGWKTPLGAVAVRAVIVDRRPDTVQFVTSATIWAVALLTLLRYRANLGAEVVVVWGLLVLASILLTANVLRWHRNRRHPEMGARTVAVVVGSDELSLWDGSIRLKTVRATSISKMKVRQWRKSLYVDLEEEGGGRVGFRLPVDTGLVGGEFLERLRALLSQSGGPRTRQAE